MPAERRKALRKSQILRFHSNIFAIAGPGQSPEIPQPIPKNIEPTRSFASSNPFEFQEKCHCASKRGAFLRESIRCPIQEINKAPPITNRRDGSHDPNRLRNPRTFWGFVIPERASQTEKIRPAQNEETIEGDTKRIRCCYKIYPWRIEAVIMPNPKNIAVATIERTDHLPIPQTACPLVQPLAKVVPTPTNIPAITTPNNHSDGIEVF